MGFVLSLKRSFEMEMGRWADVSEKVVKEKVEEGTSLMVPVAKTQLPVQGAWVWSLVGELDPTCRNWKRTLMLQLKPGPAK